MKFNTNFRKLLEENLQKNISYLGEMSIMFLELHKESPFKVALSNSSDMVPPFSIDIDSCIKTINETIEIDQNPKLLFKAGLGDRFFENDIRFTIKQRIFPQWGTSDYLQYNEWRKDLEYECEDMYWTNKLNEDIYEAFKDIQVFEDKIISNDIPYDRIKTYIFDVNSWLKYCHNLAEIFFPEYKYNEHYSTKTIRRYLVELNDELFFGFEYDESEIKNELKKDRASLPYYLNLILINKSFNPKTPIDKYIVVENEDIISLGILGNPFFYKPCFPLDSYLAIEVDRQYNIDRSYAREYIKVDDAHYITKHSQKLADKIKRHAFFYMDILSASSKSYLDYLNKCLPSP